MEGDINAGERNCSKVRLKDNIALSILFPSIDTQTLTSTNSGSLEIAIIICHIIGWAIRLASACNKVSRQDDGEHRSLEVL